ncbi:hypothetical protein [Gracilibacillus salinarum]|uniref:DUF4367 domain-containing protein n=1 Tax=Gracilibacillus salinarum TaxID=2932255 RepID=A0ABY4GQ34_9BACI|nr:hypothetical protein [Gracilibacillus salinarum]UOQ86331.1 hypothetical protein MUN87_05425 [Gracilibacillus salinarum]
MRMEKFGFLTVSILLIFVIAMSIWSIEPTEEVLTEATDVAENQFEQEIKDPNEELDHFSLFVPEGFEVEEQSQNNVILTKDNQTYILFYNKLESDTSKLNYEAAMEMEDHDKLVSFEDQDRFGYINIAERDDQFEVQLGVGGVKVTTISSKQELTEDVKSMMNMANSLAYVEEMGAS